MGIQLGHAGRKGATKSAWEGSDEPLDEGGRAEDHPGPDLQLLAGLQVPCGHARDPLALPEEPGDAGARGHARGRLT